MHALEVTGPADRLPASHPATAISEASAIVQMIERAASNPAVDLDKLERLMTMRREIEAQRAETAFSVAMKNAQAEMGRVAADAVNPQTRSRYASYAALDRALRPIYTQHGFALSFDEADCPQPEHVRILCYVSHEAGHTRTYRKDMPADGKGARGGDVMTKTHATGAAASYGMRYLLKGIFNVAIGEDDRDGNAVPQSAPHGAPAITDEQAMQVRELLEATGSDAERFARYLRIDSIAEMPAAKFGQAMALLRQKAARS